MQPNWALKPKCFILLLGLIMAVDVGARPSGKSRRVIRDEPLNVQPSSSGNPSDSLSVPLPPSTNTERSPLLKGYAPSATPKAAPSKNPNEGMAAAAVGAAALMGAFAGDSKGESTSATSYTPYTPSSYPNTGVDSYQPGPAANISRYSANPEIAPSTTIISNRECSPNTQVWQPPTALPFRVTSCYGHRPTSREPNRRHDGLDMVVISDNPKITPVAPGKIVKADWEPGYGCQIVIEHENCPANAKAQGKCYSHYAHLSDLPNGCPGTMGQKVGPCDEIATMGKTGASGELHLHMELRTGIEAGTDISPISNFTEWRAHENYKAEQSSCGSRMNVPTPSKLSPTEEVNAVQ